MELTPAQVKNLMRRGLRRLLDPEPDGGQKWRAFEFFDHTCAYCGISIETSKADLDHLVSASQHGTNHISNRVPSCKRCNAFEKRESDWQEFLRRKCGGETPLYIDRKQKIEQWIATCGGALTLSDDALRILEEESQRVTAVYDTACGRIRSTRP